MWIFLLVLLIVLLMAYLFWKIDHKGKIRTGSDVAYLQATDGRYISANETGSSLVTTPSTTDRFYVTSYQEGSNFYYTFVAYSYPKAGYWYLGHTPPSDKSCAQKLVLIHSDSDPIDNPATYWRATPGAGNTSTLETISQGQRLFLTDGLCEGGVVLSATGSPLYFNRSPVG